MRPSHLPAPLGPRFACALALVLQAPASDGDVLAFAPAEGVRWSKTIERTIELEQVERTLILDGEPESLGGVLELRETLRFEVSDEAGALAGAGLGDFVRHYGAVESSRTSAEDAPDRADLQRTEERSNSPLAGRAVRFERAAEGAWSAAAADDGPALDAELLKELAADTDFTALLPSGPVPAGAIWSIEPEQLRPLLSPGGELGLEPAAPGAPQPASAANRFDDWLGALGGSVTATYKGAREASEDSPRLGIIELSFELEASIDATQAARALSAEGSEEQVESARIDSVQVASALTGTGELAWDLDLGVAHAFELAGQLGLAIDTSLAVTVDGETFAYDESTEFAGAMTVTLARSKASAPAEPAAGPR